MNPLLQALAYCSTSVGRLEPADLVGQVGLPGEGPFMTMYLRLNERRITEARFETYGCPTALACGTWVTRWVVGKGIEEVAVLTAGDLITVLGGVPLGKEHCASLAVDALKRAVEQVHYCVPAALEDRP